MAKVTAPSKAAVAVALPVALETIAAQVAGALQETASLSETLGDLTRDAGKSIVKKPELLEPFVDACKQMCASVGLSEGSFKVYMSHIRGVLRAMVEGFKPAAGATLRQMYDAAPKGTGRQKATGARHAMSKPGSGDESGDSAGAAAVAPADAKRDAIRVLFGHCDDELSAAVAWAVQNEASFIRYVKANIQAAKAIKGAPIKKAA